jgi:hypothetical protein
MRVRRARAAVRAAGRRVASLRRVAGHIRSALRSAHVRQLGAPVMHLRRGR